MAKVQWRKAADDGTAWVADPEPAIHLAVWKATQGHIGWDWHALDPQGNRLAMEWGKYTLEDAKASAEAWYASWAAAHRR